MSYEEDTYLNAANEDIPKKLGIIKAACLCYAGGSSVGRQALEHAH
jgi:hypothetical protein